MSSSVAELDIDTIGAGGDGVGRFEGMVVFVPRTAPGDRVRVRLDARKRFARGTVEEILTPSAARVAPPCAHYRIDRCGGCQLQHIEYVAQLEMKARIIHDSLTRIGKRDVPPPVVTPSERQWRYRTKLTLAMRRSGRGHWVVGLHPYDDAGAVFQLRDCPIADDRVIDVWRQIMAASAHFPDGDEFRASVRLAENSERSPGDGSGGGAALVVMEGGHRWPQRAAFFAAVPGAASLWWRPAHRARVLVATRGSNASTGPSFAQVNPTVAAVLHAYVVERALAHRPATVVDAYAGSGATAIALARVGVRVAAIDADADAVAACAPRLPDESHAVAGRVEHLLEVELPADVVLLNPPRTGVHEHVATILQGVTAPPRAIIYVSCDPATLARDLARLPRYRIASVHAFDMFPQTAHVETVCELVPDSRTGAA